MKKAIFIAIALLAFVCRVPAQTKVRVEAPSLVGLGEQFNVQVTVEGQQTASEPEWNPGEDFQIVWGPQKVGSSTSISIINGNKTTSSQQTFLYILLPHKKGSFTLPPVTVTVGGSQVSSSQVRIEVATDGASQQQSSSSRSRQQSPEPAADVRGGNVESFLRFNISKSNVVVGEPITATLKLYTRANVAGFEDVKMPTFNGFWSQETYSPSNVEFRREELNDKIYLTAVLRQYTLIPQQVGKVVIEPAELTLVANVQVAPSGINSIFDSFFEDVRQVRKKAVSAGYTVNVKSLPSGAPASFNGGVGNFRISASFAADSLKTHEASVLRITVSGKGNIALCEAPKVQFPSDFEVYDVKTTDRLEPDKLSGSRTFEYPFIPRSYGRFEIPTVQYSYFDTSTGKYETASSDPLVLDVGKGSVSDSKGGNAVVGFTGKDVATLDNDIRFISTKIPANLREGSVFALSPLFFILAALIVLAGAAVCVAERKIAAQRADVAGAKNRGAMKMARKRLSMAGGFLERNEYTSFYEELHRAMLGFVADKFNMDSASLSKDNISSSLEERGVDGEVSSRFVSLLDACEYARYSPDAGHEAMDEHYREALAVLTDIDTEMKKKGKTSAAAVVISVLFCLWAPSSFSQAPDSLWNSAVKAYVDGQWEQSLADFKALEAEGARSDELYYNIGNAYYECGRTAGAILYYERALKLNPSHKDAAHNLEFVKAGIQDRIESVPEFFLTTWTRNLCRALPADVWAVVFLVLLAGTVAMALLFRLSGSRRGKRSGFFVGIVLLLFAVASFSFLVWQKNDMEDRSRAVVMSPVSSVKSSPGSEGARTLFVLHEGTGVRVTDSVGDWVNVVIADGREGWIKSEDIEVI